MRIDHYIHFTNDSTDSPILKRIERLLVTMTSENAQAFEDIRSRIDTATTNLAGDIRRLAEQIGTGMSQEEVDTAKAGLEQAAVGLEAVAAETPEP